MSQLNNIIFRDKTFSDLLDEIYLNQNNKKNIIDNLIQELKPLMKDIGDAVLLVPLIKDYLDMGVKNDELLIKMATIIQRVVQNQGASSEGSLGISEEEKKQLLIEVNKLKNDK